MIGVFDSGMGGLTVAKSLLERLAGYDIVYFGDTARTPYGTKSPETVCGYALENTEFLLGKGAKIILVACNTASSVAGQVLRERFDVPIFEVVSPAVESALSQSRQKRIGVIGTRATINSGIYETTIKSIAADARVYSAACPLLVPLVEEGWLKRRETAMIVKKYLHPLKARQIDTLILGCTHYPLLIDILRRKIGKGVRIVDSSSAVAEQVREFVDGNAAIRKGLSRNGHIRFFVSDVTEQFERIARQTLNRKLLLEHVCL